MGDLNVFHLPNLHNKNPWEFFENRIRSVAELKRLLPVDAVEQKEWESRTRQSGSKQKQMYLYTHSILQQIVHILRLLQMCEPGTGNGSKIRGCAKRASRSTGQNRMGEKQPF